MSRKGSRYIGRRSYRLSKGHRVGIQELWADLYAFGNEGKNLCKMTRIGEGQLLVKVYVAAFVLFAAFIFLFSTLGLREEGSANERRGRSCCEIVCVELVDMAGSGVM